MEAGADLEEGDHQVDTEGATQLAHEIGDAGALAHLVGGQRLQGGGVEAGVDEAQPEPRDHHHADQGPEGGVDVGRGHQDEARREEQQAADDHGRGRHGVGETAGQREDEGEHNAGRHHHQAGQQRREADDGLHEHRHDVGRAHHAGAEDEGDQRRRRELDIAEDAHVQESTRRLELPPDEGHGGERAPHQPEDDGVGGPALALAVGDAGHQAQQGGTQQAEAQPVEGRDHLGDGPRRHEDEAQDGRDHAEGQRDEEDVAPGEVFDHQPAQRRADRGCEDDTQAKHAHRHAAALRREDGEDGGHDQGLGHAGAEALQDTGEDQGILGRGGAAQQGAEREEEQRADKGAALAQHAGQPGIDQHARRHGGHVGRRHPLRLVLADAEGAHHVGHRDVDRGHGQHHRDHAHHAGDGDQPAIGRAVVVGEGGDGLVVGGHARLMLKLLSPARGRGGVRGSAGRGRES